MKDKEVNDFLQHHGVKGQKWGVRKKEETGGNGGSGSTKPLSKPPHLKGIDEKTYSNLLRSKYEPYTGEKKEEEKQGFHVTPTEKKLALGIGGALLVAGVAYAGHKHLSNLETERLAKLGVPRPHEHFMVAAYKRADDVPMEKYCPGMAAHWDKGLDLPAGTIFKRMSTIKETEIRPQGFFAAFEHSDIERYKAELPPYWKMWGYKETSGYLVDMKASASVKAPSGEETFKLFKEYLSSSQRVFDRLGIDSITRSKLSPEDADKVLSGFAKETFPNFAMQWCHSLEGHADVQGFFKLVKSRGYNALIDFNDAGHLARTPVRLLDGHMFSVVGHEAVSENAIKLAQQNLKALVMAAMNEINEFLAHYGKVGMKWGSTKKADLGRIARVVTAAELKKKKKTKPKTLPKSKAANESLVKGMLVKMGSMRVIDMHVPD